ncbi:hypothetical protein PV733_39975 [Streptomyces europaeiscabiei]|uniref:hypothetical protein n=1 Tax=Streptomyces europaeiscabiei TaxID=146819 RepID=UPI0029B56C5F|nr:hypothetical protein [Streptomyces europaeiscabiei]MDX3714999.1 hypothetical protein [Streptomyces europaeiscabiei]
MADTSSWTASQEVRVENGYGYGVIGADLHVYPDRGPVYLLTGHRGPCKPTLDTEEDTRFPAQPSRVLNARYAMVDFTGRKHDLERLSQWRDGGTHRLAAVWLHGPGGQGKTRLADEFAQLSAALGWLVVDARHGPGSILPAPGSTDLRLSGAAGLLLLVDYADRWPLSHLSLLLSNAVLRRDHPARVLFIARSAHPWPAVRAVLEDLNAHATDLPLAPLPADTGLADRRAMFEAARRCFARLYKLHEQDPADPPDRLGQPEFGLPLMLHMAALVGVDSRARGLEGPTVNLSAYLLDRERAHWTRLYETGRGQLDFRTPPGTMAHAVFTAALHGAAPYAEALDTVASLGLDTQPSRILQDHAVCYPPATADAALEPLYPDRLAEDFLALTIPGHTLSAHPPEPWAPRLAGLLTGATPGRAPVPVPRTARAIAFLAASAAPGRWPHVGAHLDQILSTAPHLARTAGNDALVALARVDQIRSDTLAAVTATLPAPGGDGDLIEGAAAIVRRLTHERLRENVDVVARATARAELVEYLIDGNLDLVATEESRSAIEELEEAYARWSDRPGITAAYALALHLQSTVSSMNRQEDAARDELSRSVALYRTCGPDAAPGLTGALVDLAATLGAEGRAQEAVDVQREALGLAQRLAKRNPEMHERTLGDCWNNMAAHLWGAGRREEALEAAQRAVKIRRVLADADLQTHGQRLSQSLRNVFLFLYWMDRNEEALQQGRVATALLRELAAANPYRFQGSLADWLAVFAGVSGSTQEFLDEALASIAESLAILGRMATQELRFSWRHGQTLGTLDRSCETAAMLLHRLGRDEESALAGRIRSSLRFIGGGPPPRTFTRLAMLLERLGRADDARWLAPWGQE